MNFQSPLFFLLLPLLLAAGYYYKKKYSAAAFIFPTEESLQGLKPSLKTGLAKNLFVLRIVSLCCIVFALARPQAPIEESKIQTEGIDIVLAIDVSSSMRACDFTLAGKRANRLQVVKDVVKDFIKARENDRIGLVAFAAGAYTVSPLTLDYAWLLQNIERIKIGMIEDGTAIGLGLSSALRRLKDTQAKSKVVILLTDGRNNTGDISPALAAEMAKVLGIKVYTIGAGTKGLAPYPVRDFFGNTVYKPIKIDIDEDTLKDIAAKTEGRYFRATDTASLRKTYSEINGMEKTPIEEKGYLQYRQLFTVFLAAGLIFLLVEIILGNTLLKRIP
jgi:Ca-activated chloride channel family protein